ncbi:hypothetical protein MTR_4g081000 [Medicago truncatula]|uniref:ABC transporter domain-containing protein n=1 Tax=Medicago truncatula TaxID=3880 RepID=G7JDX1_MEDTR|nr:hypothetical protein MTR_4g081000 [Medicago truncatula]
MTGSDFCVPGQKRPEDKRAQKYLTKSDPLRAMEVGSGKSTLLTTILGEVYKTKIDVHGKFGYVSQTAWIQTGTIRENIFFGSELDDVIGERGVNLNEGSKWKAINSGRRKRDRRYMIEALLTISELDD